MANRQYVGARYVPKFYQGSNGNEWDSNVVYEALTMVTYLGSTYCSKKPVPARTVAPNIDTEYWVLTAAYSSQVAELREEVDGIESDITTNIKPDILANTTAIGTNTTAINKLKSTVNMSDRKFLFVGDSYGSQTETWVNPCVQFAGITSYTNACVSGTAFYDGSFLTQISSYSGNKSEITDIVVGGGLNDSIFSTIDTNYNTLKNAIINFATYAKTNYPNAKLWLSFMGNAIDDAPLIDGRTWNKRCWAKWTYEAIGRANGFTIITNSDYALCMNQALFKVDKIHPNAQGAENIGINIANVLCGGDNVLQYPSFNAGLSPSGNNVIESANNLLYSFNNGMFDFSIGEFIVNIATDYGTVSGMTKIELATMSSIYFNKPFVIDVEGRLDFYNSKNFNNVKVTLEFTGNKIKACLNDINSTGNAYESYTKVSNNGKMTFTRGFNFTVPAYYIN